VIVTLSTSTVTVGGTIDVTTGGAVQRFSLIRFGSATHSVNTDQRRIPLEPKSGGGNKYTITVPSDPAVALPGYWMLFAIQGGVPSVAETVLVKGK
jgi:galactose oxidase